MTAPVSRTFLPGTHELSVMVAAGEQVARRSVRVHFSPYRESDSEEREAFKRIFGQLVSGLPLSDPKLSWDALGSHLRDVYMGCAGCVGILKGWLCRSLQQALETDRELVDWPVMEACALSPQALLAIAEPIQAYREFPQPGRQEIERALGLEPLVLPTSSSTSSSSSSRRKPGQRLPARDPVGLTSEGKCSV